MRTFTSLTAILVLLVTVAPRLARADSMGDTLAWETGVEEAMSVQGDPRLTEPAPTGPTKLKNVGSLTAKLCSECPYEQWCSGTLIGKRAFATAAHCIYVGYNYGAIGFGASFVDEFPVDPENPFSFPLPEGAVNHPGTPVFHPDYTLTEYFNGTDPETSSDIAVVVLDEPVSVPIPALPRIGALDRMADRHASLKKNPMLGIATYGMTDEGTWDVPDWGTRRVVHGPLLRRFASAAELGAPVHHGDSGAPVYFVSTTRLQPRYMRRVLGMGVSGFNKDDQGLRWETGMFIRFDVPRIRDFLETYADM